jgi:predicted choloylglycine hydrolase
MESRTYRNVTFLRLKGTHRERAEQHGRYLSELPREVQRKLAFAPLSRINQSLIRRATHRLPGVGRLISGLYEAFVLERYLRLPKAYRSRITPFARASKIPQKKIWLSLYQPDFLMVLAASSNPRNQSHYLQGLPGCSTTRILSHGQTYFIRNLDYPAVSYWEKLPTVFFHEPTDPGAQKYVSISSLGMQVSGVTGWNESGIAISLHAHFSKKVSLRGIPIFFLGEDILEKARTLDEAIDMCRKFRPMGAWGLNITSFHENRSVAVEMVDGDISVREPGDSCGIAHANAFQSPEFQKTELHFLGAFLEDSIARKRTMEDAARVLASDFTWSGALSVLGSHHEPNTGEKRVFGNILSTITTIQSMGFDPVEKCIYLSMRDETPVGLGPYLRIPFDYDQLPPDDSWQTVSVNAPHSSDFLAALHLYHQAYVSWQVHHEEPKVAHAFLIQATELLPRDPHLLMQRGYFELIAEQAQEAWNCFNRALELPLTPHLRQISLYFRACAWDLLGNREAALKDCQALLDFDTTERRLAKKAKKRLNSPFQAAYCQRIEPDLQFVEPLNYP